MKRKLELVDKFIGNLKGNKNPRWFVQGNSGYNFTGLEYTTNLYLGGFQIEEIAEKCSLLTQVSRPQPPKRHCFVLF